jgi:hypothetical protein
MRKGKSTHHAMQKYAGVEVQLNEFLTLRLDADSWLASRPNRFTTEERTLYQLDRRPGKPLYLFPDS